jgi:ParB family chromosome partitioning protein
MRILDLPEDMLTALSEGRINEGHTRPLLMLIDRPEEQKVLFQDIMLHKMNVRDAELAARKIAIERVRKFNASVDPEICALEEKFAESLGTRVKIEKKENGGKLTIEFFSNDDLEDILKMLKQNQEVMGDQTQESEGDKIPDDRTPVEIKIAEDTPIEEDLYSIKNFSI